MIGLYNPSYLFYFRPFIGDNNTLVTTGSGAKLVGIMINYLMNEIG